ncbi:MAG: major facilitator superfamily protein [Bacillota bacterium]|nr:MAG: major facilitator superfamily protein [Bacillota bacterium]
MTTGQLNRNMRWNNINGILSTLANNMVGPFLGIFAISLGASDSQIAALSSWPALVSLFAMIPGARFVDSSPRKKKLVAIFQALNRVFFVGLAFLPTIIVSADKRPAVLVAAVALMNLPGAIANVSWQSFIGGIIPPERRAEAFAKRNQLMGACGAVASLIAGRIMGVLRFPVGYQVMFLVGFLLALLEIASLLQINEGEAEPATVTHQKKPLGFAAFLKEAKTRPQYYRFAAASLVFHFGWQMGWPLFTKFQVQELLATPQWVSLFGVCSTLGSTLAYPVWSKFSTQKGNRYMLTIAAGALALTPLFYATSTALWMLAVWSMVMGVSLAGIILLLFNTLLEVCPIEGRTQYIAYHNTLLALRPCWPPMLGSTVLASSAFAEL